MKNDKTYKIVMTGLMMCLVMVATMIIRIPIPATEGYVHLGDAAIFMSVLILGKKGGAFAAGIGSALADLLSGYAYYAPITLVVKALMAILTGLVLEHMEKRGQIEESVFHRRLTVMEVAAMVSGGSVMAAGYYIAESFMYGSWITPLASIPANIGQFVVGTVIATILAQMLYRTPAKKYFAIK